MKVSIGKKKKAFEGFALNSRMNSKHSILNLS